METPVIFLHGFSREQVLAIMRAVKAVAAETGIDPKEIAFATSTPTNMEWKVRDLIDEVRQEHEYLKNNPPYRIG